MDTYPCRKHGNINLGLKTVFCTSFYTLIDLVIKPRLPDRRLIFVPGKIALFNIFPI